MVQFQCVSPLHQIQVYINKEINTNSWWWLDVTSDDACWSENKCLVLYYVSEYYSVIQYSWSQGGERMGYRKGRDSEGRGGNITRRTEPQHPILMTITHASSEQARKVVCSHADNFLQFHSYHNFYELQNFSVTTMELPLFLYRTLALVATHRRLVSFSGTRPHLVTMHLAFHFQRERTNTEYLVADNLQTRAKFYHLLADNFCKCVFFPALDEMHFRNFV